MFLCSRILTVFVKQSIPKKQYDLKLTNFHYSAKENFQCVFGVQETLWHRFNLFSIFFLINIVFFKKPNNRRSRMKCFDLTCHLCFGWQIDTKVGREKRREEGRSGHKDRAAETPQEGDVKISHPVIDADISTTRHQQTRHQHHWSFCTK